MDLHVSACQVDDQGDDASPEASGELPQFEDGVDHDRLHPFDLPHSADEHDVFDQCAQLDPGIFELGDSSGLQLCSGLGISQRETIALQPVVSSSVHDATFSRNLFSNFDATGIKLPWETGIFRELLGDGPLSEPLVPKMPIGNLCSFDVHDTPQHVADSVARVAMPSTSTPVFESCIASGDDLNYFAKRQQLRDVAIGKFLIVLRQWPTASKTGRLIANLDLSGQQQDEVNEILNAVLGVKSPATLIKRANALLAFMRWAVRTGRGMDSPFNEQTVWEYFQHLKSSGAAATRADSTLSSLRFAFYLLGFESLEPTLCSRRLTGICEIMLAGKRLLRQALVLTVTQVLQLHAILEDPNRHLVDRALVAYILFALYWRCRNSDLLAIHSIDTDFDLSGGYVIVNTCNHKSGRMAALKTRLMPIIIPCRGVDGSVWPFTAFKVMKDVGSLQSYQVDGPLLRAPSTVSGEFMRRGLKTMEVSKVLRSFLNIDEPAPGSTNEVVSSHSLKATFLAWSARFGLSPQTRSLLGRHTTCLNETFAIYSRDLACAPVAELQRLIDAVHDGTFVPDGERSKFFRAADSQTCEPEMEHVKHEQQSHADVISVSDSSQDLVAEGPDHVEAEDPGSDALNLPTCEAQFCPVDLLDVQSRAPDDATDSSSSDSGASTSEETDVQEPPSRVKRFRARIPTHEKWYVHSKSHLVHRFDGDAQNDARFLVCGKRLTGSYVPCTEATAWNVLCKSCNRR